MGTREVLHLEGKRARDVQRDSEQRKGLKRKNMESKASEETNKRKEASNKKREEILKEFASVEKIAILCSGQEKCCNGRCLEVREFDYMRQLTRTKESPGRDVAEPRRKTSCIIIGPKSFDPRGHSRPHTQHLSSWAQPTRELNTID